MLFKLLFEDVSVLTLEQSGLVELASGLCDFKNCFQSTVGDLIVFMGPRSAVVISGQVWAQARYSPKKEHRVEVDILKAFGM